MMTITVSGTSADELKSKLLNLVHTFNVIEADPKQLSFPIDQATQEVEEAPKKTKKAAPKKAAAKVQVEEPVQEENAADDFEAAEVVQTFTKDDVTHVLRDSFADDVAGALALLKKYGASKVRELKEEDYSKIIADAKARS